MQIIERISINIIRKAIIFTFIRTKRTKFNFIIINIDFIA